MKQPLMNLKAFPWVLLIWLCPVFVFVIFPGIEESLNPLMKLLVFNSVYMICFGIGAVPYFRKQISRAEFLTAALIPFLIIGGIVAILVGLK